jgi:hypothetical protein
MLSAALSLLVGYGIYADGKASDCKPHEVDGQCGLSTFVGLITGIGVGAVLLLVASGYVLYRAYKNRKAS